MDENQNRSGGRTCAGDVSRVLGYFRFNQTDMKHAEMIAEGESEYNYPDSIDDAFFTMFPSLLRESIVFSSFLSFSSFSLKNSPCSGLSPL